MDLRQLEIIRAIADAGSFTGAGEKLHVSQSAISRQILLLEEELNEAVFLRVGRRIRITPAGEALLQLSHRVFADLKDTVALISDSRQALRGPVRLVGGMTVSLYVFPALLREFRRVHPQAELKIWAGSTEKCTAAIRAGTADLGLLTLPIEEPDLVSVPAIAEELLLVTSPTHPLARKKRIIAADLRRQNFVLFESGSNTRRVIDEFFLRENLDPKIVMETENVEIIKAMVKTGMGVGIVPYQAVAREVRAGQFFCTRIDGHQLVRETGWVYARANRVPRVIHELLAAFDAVKGKFRLAPPSRRQSPAGT
jgi:LysR family transcriptional regulator, low CO2-responsive transcriptional regulator